MVLGQFASQEITDSGSQEGENHFVQIATQKKGEAATRQSGGKAESNRRVKSVELLDLVKLCMKLFSGQVLAVFWKLMDKTLQTIQLGSIDSCIGQTQRLRKTVVSIETGVVDGNKTDIGGAGDVELLGQRIH